MKVVQTENMSCPMMFKSCNILYILCLDSMAHGLQSLAGTDPAMSYVYTALFNVCGLLVIWKHVVY